MNNIAATRWFLGAICFTSGGLTLAIEIAGNRLLAPLFGNSVSTWTALIGVVLVAISVGDLLGGVLVDRSPRLPPLAFLLLSAAACLLAAVSPFVVRLLSRTSGDHAIGRSAGLVGMLSTLGSFVGTFVTGFFLIPQIGVRAVFLASGLLTAAVGVAVLAWGRERRRVPVGLAGVVVVLAAGMASRMTPDVEDAIHNPIELFVAQQLRCGNGSESSRSGQPAQ